MTIRRLAGVPDFLTSEDMLSMVNDDRIDPKMVFSYVQEVLQRITISPSKETKTVIDHHPLNILLDLAALNLRSRFIGCATTCEQQSKTLGELF